jgi:hypothetical protein
MQEQPPKGLAPEEALRKWCDPVAVREMDKLSAYSERSLLWILGDPPTEYERKHEQWRQRRDPLEKDVLRKLKTDEWTATALELPVTLNSRRKGFPSDFWEFLELDFKTASAEGNGLKLVEIQIERSNGHGAAESRTTPPQGLSAPLQPQQAPKTASIELQLWDDGAILTLSGEKMMFRGTIQRVLLRELIEAHKNGRRLRTADTLRKVGAEVDSIAKLFRKNPHWPQLRKIIRQKLGFCWIDLSTPP